MKNWRRRLQHWLFWTVSGCLIVAAVLVGLIQLALPWWASDPGRVARLLASRLRVPVSIEATEPSWSTRGPVIALRGLQLGEGDSALRIEHAAWAVDFAGLVLPGRVLNEFRVHGLDLTLSRHADGRWEVHGLPELLRGDSRRPFSETLRALPAFALRDSQLQVRFSPDHDPLRLQLPELRRVGGGAGNRWRGRIRPQGSRGDAHDLSIALELAEGRGRAFVRADRVRLAHWLGTPLPLPLHPRNGRLDLRAWIDFDDRGVRDTQAELSLGASEWQAAPAPGVEDLPAPVELPEVDLGLRWQREGERSALLVDDLRIDGRPLGRIAGSGRGGALRLRATGLELAPLAPLAEVLVPHAPAARRALREGRPGGLIEVLEVDLGEGGLRQFVLHVRGLSLHATAGLPGVQGLDLRVLGDSSGLVAWPEGQGLMFEYPGVFAAPIRMDVGGGAISGWRDDGGWHFDFGHLRAGGEGFEVVLAGGVSLPPGAPMQLDFGARIGPTEIEAVKAFWPLNRIPNTARWLNRSLRGGRIADGAVWIRGPVGRFPFPAASGHFEATARVEDAGLDYHAGWPSLDDIEADLVFENMGMVAYARHARMGEVVIERASAAIPDLKRPIMRAEGEGRGDGRGMLALLRATPVQQRWGEHIAGMNLEGPARALVDLHIPLRQDLGQSTVDGRVFLSSARFQDSARQLDFGNVDGELRFTRHGVTVADMAVTLAGEPARLALRIGNAVTDPAHVLEGELHGRLSAAALFGGIDYLAPLLANTRGRADWDVLVQVPVEAQAGSGPGARVRVDSDLRGIALALPAPLAKSMGDTLPLRLETRLAPDGQERPLELRVGSLLHMKARLPGGGPGFAGAVALGGAAPEQVPRLGLSISGQVPALDLTGWLALDAREDESAATWPPIFLRAGELGMFGRAFRDVDLQMLPQDGTVRLQLRGPDIEGEADWPKAREGRIVRGRFTRLHIPEAASTSLGGDIHPASMPALDMEADDVRVGNRHLGRTVLRAAPVDGEFRVDRFRSRSPAFDLDASGVWRHGQDGDRSQFDIALQAGDLGRMLESFGFSRLIDGGRTRANIRGSWAGSPAAFALERIDGVLELEVGSGRILDIDPGMGRLFGLLNLREIPRRLVLDFRDIFGQGMRFNSIEGSFRLETGQAFTENVMLKAPAADILIAGRTGLIQRDYDQILEVTPRVGGTLPVVGGIAGGPAGAAAGLLMQGLMRANRVNQIVYRVTGPWDAPVISKQEPPAAAPSRPRNPASTQEPAA